MSNKSTGQPIWSIARQASDLKVLQHACATDQTKKDMPLYFTPAMDMLPFRFLLLERISTNTVLKSSFKILVPLIPFFKNLVINTQE